jgi:hypothetical protein
MGVHARARFASRMFLHKTYQKKMIQKNENMQITTTKNTQNNHEHHEKSQTHQDEPWQD